MKLIKNVVFKDKLQVPSERTINDAGMMIVPCSFARTGIQMYSASQLGITDVDENTPISVYRDEASVFEKDSIASFRSAPLTLGHPMLDGNPVGVTADNSKEFQVGFLEGLPIRDEDLLTGTLVISDKKAIEAIEDGKSQLSAGYTCDLEFVDVGDDSKIYQRNIRANHIAIVDEGRAGNSCCIADSSYVPPKTKPPKKDETLLADAMTLVASKDAELLVMKASLADVKSKLALADILASAAETWKKLETEEINSKVKELVDVIAKAKDLTDSVDFEGKSSFDIKSEVLKELLPKVDLEDKSSEYVDARFDLLFEQGLEETPMGRLLRDNARHKVADVKDPVKEARKSYIERNK